MAIWMANLDPITSQTIEQHLRECDKCNQAYKAHALLIRSISDRTPYYKALRDCVNEFNPRCEKRSPNDHRKAFHEIYCRYFGANSQSGQAVPFGTQWSWLALAATIVLAAVIASNLVPRLQTPGADQLLATQLIASHVRSLMANHLTDVASSDQHTPSNVAGCEARFRTWRGRSGQRGVFR